MMDKEYILQEIRRTAKENNGIPLGYNKFEAETGIKHHDWYGRYWAKWSDALIEAGYSPNKLNSAYDEIILIEKVIAYIRDIEKFPTAGELRLKAHDGSGFPSPNTIRNRLGGKSEMASKLLVYCVDKPEYSDISNICKEINEEFKEASEQYSKKPDVDFGFVYLMKVGRYYKIGRAGNVEKRRSELSIVLPEGPRVIHTIKTDDSVGVEYYWHNRFSDKRKKGELFDLSPSDISAFKRWRIIY